jgi:prepilin signal peptidase PulO-like enzyme (type II secretory pathway)
MFVFWTLVWALLLFITVYDIRHTIIPWSFSIALLALSLFSLVTHFSLVWLLAGPLLALPLFLFSLVSNGRWMGWGDSLLMLSLGWLLGPGVGLAALMLAFWSGAVVGLLLILLSRWKRITSRFTIKSEIPFAPFLALGAVLAYFLHVDFLIPFAFLW